LKCGGAVKIEACLYRVIEHNSARDVRISGRVLAKAAGSAERSVDAERKTLAAKVSSACRSAHRAARSDYPGHRRSSKASGQNARSKARPHLAPLRTAVLHPLQDPTSQHKLPYSTQKPGLPPRPEHGRRKWLQETTLRKVASGPAIGAPATGSASTTAAGCSARIAEPAEPPFYRHCACKQCGSSAAGGARCRNQCTGPYSSYAGGLDFEQRQELWRTP